MRIFHTFAHIENINTKKR